MQAQDIEQSPVVNLCQRSIPMKIGPLQIRLHGKRFEQRMVSLVGMLGVSNTQFAQLIIEELVIRMLSQTLFNQGSLFGVQMRPLPRIQFGCKLWNQYLLHA